MSNDDHTPQYDQFGFDLGDAPANRPVTFDPGEIREDMIGILSNVRSITEASGVDARLLRYNQILFPQLAKWLPDDEAAQLCFEFAQEIERIELLLAA